MANVPRARPAGHPSAGRWLALAALATVLPLLAALTEPVLDPLRGLAAPSGEQAWAAGLAGLLVGLAVAFRRGNDRQVLRRGAVVGGLLAIAAAGTILSFGMLAGAAAALEGCGRLPQPVAGAVSARARVDGHQVDAVDSIETDGQALVALLGRLRAAPFADHGVEHVGGVAARRCSVLIDGSDALAALPPLAGLGGDAERRLTDLSIWRGELEWWTASSGELVLARVVVGGHPADAWPSRGLRGQISAELRSLHWMAR